MDLVDSKNRTALTFAAHQGHADVCKILLETGADVNKKNKQGASPLWFASRFGQPDAARVLLQFGADLDGDQSTTPLWRPRPMTMWRW